MVDLSFLLVMGHNNSLIFLQDSDPSIYNYSSKINSLCFKMAFSLFTQVSEGVYYYKHFDVCSSAQLLYSAVPLLLNREGASLPSVWCYGLVSNKEW